MNIVTRIFTPQYSSILGSIQSRYAVDSAQLERITESLIPHLSQLMQRSLFDPSSVQGILSIVMSANADEIAKHPDTLYLPEYQTNARKLVTAIFASGESENDETSAAYDNFLAHVASELHIALRDASELVPTFILAFVAVFMKEGPANMASLASLFFSPHDSPAHELGNGTGQSHNDNPPVQNILGGVLAGGGLDQIQTQLGGIPSGMMEAAFGLLNATGINLAELDQEAFVQSDTEEEDSD